MKRKQKKRARKREETKHELKTNSSLKWICHNLIDIMSGPQYRNCLKVTFSGRALDRREYLMIIRDNFC